MENQEVLKAIAVLADKVSRYHERLLALERDHKRHTDGCSCHEKPKEIAKGPDYPTIGRPLTEDERMFVQSNMAKHKELANGS
jgi:hypothetical protein